MSIQTKQPDESGTPAPSADRPSMTPRLSALARTLLIASVAFLLYWPSLSGGFILDDDLLLTNNSLIKRSDGWNRFWYTTDQADYVPLTSTTLWFEWRLWGMSPTGYHVANLVLHIAACLLMWVILRRLSIPGAFLAALLFAIHPVNVESVAWVEQRKNTLSMLFFLLSILWYLKAEMPCTPTGCLYRRGAGRWFWLSLLAFALAMFSKGSVATLPLLLLLIVWWQRGSITQWDLLRSAPFFLVAAVLTPVIIWFVTHGSGETARNATFVQRLLGAGAVLWFYLSKALLPINLLFVYPQWNIGPDNPLWWLPLLAVVVITALLVWQCNSLQSNWSRPLLFAWAFFCVALAPVLGFTDSGYAQFSLVAEHYQYIAIIGVVALVAAGFSDWRDRTTGPARKAPLIVAAVVVVALGRLNWQQNCLYGDPIKLYQAALPKNPQSWLIHNNLGIKLAESGQIQEAIEHYQQVLQIKPDYAQARYNLGIALVRLGKHPEAIAQYQEALRLKPDFAEAHNNLGTALASLGNLSEAIPQYREALRLKPDFAEAHNNLGNALSKSNQPREAIEQYELALRIKQNYSEARANLAAALVSVGRLPEAIEHYQQALQLRPDNFDALANMALAYAAMKRPQEAIAAAEKAVILARSHGEAALAQQIESWLTNYRAQQAHPQGASTQSGTVDPSP